jgi:ferredoxin
MVQQNTSQAAKFGATTALRVVVDLNRCQGYAQCCFLAPGAFWLHGEEALWYDLAPDEAQRDHVLRAVAACPVQAILLGWPEEAGQVEAHGENG